MVTQWCNLFNLEVHAFNVENPRFCWSNEKTSLKSFHDPASIAEEFSAGTCGRFQTHTTRILWGFDGIFASPIFAPKHCKVQRNSFFYLLLLVLWHSCYLLKGSSSDYINQWYYTCFDKNSAVSSLPNRKAFFPLWRQEKIVTYICRNNAHGLYAAKWLNCERNFSQ